MTDPKVKALVVSCRSLAAILVFVRLGRADTQRDKRRNNYTCYEPDDSDTYSHNLAQIKAQIFKIFFFRLCIFKAYTSLRQILGQTSSI